MPRKGAKGGGTIRQRPSDRWEARFTIGRDLGTGRQIQRSVYGATQKEVRQKLAQAVAALDNGTYTTPNKVTVSQWMEEWLTTFCAGKVKPLTYRSYEGIIKNHIVPVVGAIELQAVKGTQVQRLYNTMTKAGISGKTVKNVSAVLHKALSVAVKQGIIPANPLRCCRAAKGGAARERPADG